VAAVTAAAKSATPPSTKCNQLVLAGPSDPPPTGLAYQLLNAGELLALCVGQRGMVMVQVCVWVWVWVCSCWRCVQANGAWLWCRCVCLCLCVGVGVGV